MSHNRAIEISNFMDLLLEVSGVYKIIDSHNFPSMDKISIAPPN